MSESAPLPPEISGRELLGDELLAVVDAAREAVLAAPGDPARWLELGMVLDANALGAQAVGCYERAAALDPDEPRAPYHLARVLARSGRPDAALEVLAQALQLAPDHAPGHALRGAWLLDAGRPDEARAAFERAATLDPAGLAAPLGLARVALALDQPQRALDALAAVRARHPDLGEARFLAGSALRQLGRHDEAALELAGWDGARAPSFDPWEGEVARRTAGYMALMDQAVAWGQAGEAQRALPSLRALHRAAPDDSAVLEKLVAACLDTGRLDEARAVLSPALSDGAGHYRAWYSLALVEEASGRLPAALAAADRCLAQHPTWARGHELRARLLWKQGDLAGAVRALDASLASGGPRSTTLQKLARAQGLLRRWPEARRTLERALALDPGQAGVRALLAEACAEAGDLPAAVQELNRAGALEPQNALVQRAAARIEQLGRTGSEGGR